MTKTYEVWYKEEKYGANRLWGTFTDELAAEWAKINAKARGYVDVVIFTFEK